MNSVEEAGKVAVSFMEAMKTQPAVLALIVVLFAMIGFVYYQSMAFESSRRDNVAAFIKMQADMARMITQCVQPTPTL